jgi:RimJ/RimL family protein N-acetyltransferase
MDIDLFIGDPLHVGCGVGPRVLQMLLTRLWKDPWVRVVGICTSVENSRALRAFETAGFSRQRQFDDPEHGLCWFMVARKHHVAA